MSELNTPEVEERGKLDVVQMDQLPQAEVRAESPLYHADLETMATQGPKDGGVQLQELKLLGHLVLRGALTNRSFVEGVEKVLAVALPGPMQSAQAGDASIRWISPDEWLVIAPGTLAFALEKQLREVIDGHYSIVNASGGQTVITLSGKDAVNVLKKSTGYDVHESSFPVGKVVTSTFAKTQAVIRRTGTESWELVVRRTFADYIWLWLQDACAEYGLTVKK